MKTNSFREAIHELRRLGRDVQVTVVAKSSDSKRQLWIGRRAAYDSATELFKSGGINFDEFEISEWKNEVK